MLSCTLWRNSSIVVATVRFYTRGVRAVHKTEHLSAVFRSITPAIPTKALQEERPETGAEVSKRLESVKHLLWHGNTEEALELLGDLLMELSFIQARSNAAKKVADGLSEF